MKDFEIMTRQQAGTVAFENFDEIKAALKKGLDDYRNIAYTEGNVKDAKTDKSQLTKLKKALNDRRKEIKNEYMAPYLLMEDKIKELIALIDEPLLQIDGFIKDADAAQKDQRHQAVKTYYSGIASALGEFADKVFEAPAFYDAKWDNKSTKTKTWQDAVTEKMKTVSHDIQTIQSSCGAHTAPVLNEYLKTLDMSAAIEYKKSLEEAELLARTEVKAEDPDDNVIGYKVLKIYGTEMQIVQVAENLELLGLDYDELENGMPDSFSELTSPDFDTFVCFDIETSGTFGADAGDGPAEITEIGAVKVVNGKIVDKQDWLCNPGRKITPRIERLTHITNAMVADKPPVSDVIRLFAEYVGDLPLVGHNIKTSDLVYIGRAAKKAGVAMENRFFDTYIFAKKFRASEGWDNVKLEYLSEKFGISQPDAHRAWCDAEANAGVYFALKDLAED